MTVKVHLFTSTLFEMTIADCPGFHVPHVRIAHMIFSTGVWKIHKIWIFY
jgi:hypothetical protein